MKKKKIYNWNEVIYDVLEGKTIVNYTISGCSIRKWVFKLGIFEYKCSRCGINEWFEENLPLEIDHIDGDHFNNKKENLRILCPNCHSITHNYRGKKEPKIKEKYSLVNKEQEIIQLVQNGKSISEILDGYNLTKGANYKTIYKILKKNHIYIPEKKDKAIQRKILDKQKTLDRIEDTQRKINLIINSGIDFNKTGWGTKVSEILNMTPSGALRWVKREMPEFANKCWQHEK